MKVQRFFNEHPVFRHEDFVAFLESVGSHRTRTREALLAYHVKVGHLLRIRRGLYAVVPQGSDPANYQVDAYLLAGHLTADAVLSHHSALQFHGKAYSMHFRFPYLTREAQRPFVFRGQEYVAIQFPKVLQAQQAELFGVTTEWHLGSKVRVTSLERTLVDVLVRPDMAGGWEEIWRSLEFVEYFNLDQVVDYTLKLRSATAAAKVGFFLEQHREDLRVKEPHLALLRRHAPKQPCYLERSRRTPGKLVPNWNLIVPFTVLEEVWEEIG